MAQSAYVRPWRCGCDKIRYPDEAAATRVAEADPDRYGPHFSVYRCPGATCWHITTRGFHPRSLRTRNRIAAYYLSRHQAIARWQLVNEMHIDTASGQRKLGEILAAFERAGLIQEAGPDVWTAVDRDGLRRIVSVGWDYYQQERAPVVVEPAPLSVPALSVPPLSVPTLGLLARLRRWLGRVRPDLSRRSGGPGRWPCGPAAREAEPGPAPDRKSVV